MTEPTIYLDYAATSPVDPAVAELMGACLTRDGAFGNPASPHFAGRAAQALIDRARDEIGALVNAPGHRLLFTSGATEANNLALRGLLEADTGPRHLLTSRIEHRSVLDTATALEARGVTVTRLDCDQHGLVAPAAVGAAITAATRLVSIMQVNNEIGTVQDIAEIAAVCRAAGVPLHVDAAQGAGKVELDIAGWGIDLCSLTAHKLNGPKGVGALFVGAGVRPAHFLYGGEAQLGIRAGTLPTHQIVGFGAACRLAGGSDEPRALAGLRDRLWQGLAGIPGAQRNGHPERSAPHILSVGFPGVEGESLRFALADIAVSAGSACTSASPAPSHVLSSLGLADALAESTLRFGIGRFTTAAEIDRAVARVTTEVARLREIAAGAPGWCSG
jgi:cysteine desulfurase